VVPVEAIYTPVVGAVESLAEAAQMLAAEAAGPRGLIHRKFQAKLTRAQTQVTDTSKSPMPHRSHHLQLRLL